MTTIELLSASDPAQAARWDGLVNASAFPDTYYRPGYVRAYEVEGHGRAVALHIQAADHGFLAPVLLRPLRDLPFASGQAGEDAITPYGYGGILSLSAREPQPQHLRAALAGLVHWCRENNVVSWLIRLHPLLRQQDWFRPLLSEVEGLSVQEFGPTTAINVADWSPSLIRTRWRSYLSAARRALRVTWSSAAGNPSGISLQDALLTFRQIYEDTMDRLHAAAFYHFSPDYYAALADGLGSGLAVALAWQGEEVVGGTMFFADRECAHYHLSGTNEKGRLTRANMLLIGEGIEWARGRGCTRLHLGGGTRGADSLFEFKMGFGGDLYQYAFAGIIADPLRYDALLAARQGTGEPLRSGFFPAYRG